MTCSNDNIKTLSELFDNLDRLRVELLAGQESHINSFINAGFTPAQALKDWQENFSRILDAMDQCTKEARVIVLGQDS